METILRKKNVVVGIMFPDLRLLQRYSNQNIMVLTQKETRRSMLQGRRLRNKAMHLRSITL